MVHENVIGGSNLDLQQVQGDEIKFKTQGRCFWMAMEMLVSINYLAGMLRWSILLPYCFCRSLLQYGSSFGKYKTALN